MRRAACIASLLLIVACSTPAPEPTPRPTPAQTSIAFGYPAEPPTLDPLAAGGASGATRDLLRPVLPALFRLDDDLRPSPELVASWPRADDIAEDPFTVALTLREATWSDGTPITSEDVRFSHERLRDGPTGHRYRALIAVEPIDELRFRLVFDRPVRRWWALFSIDDMVLPAHAYSEEWSRGPTVAGGPLRFVEWTEGLRVRLERNDAYWGEHAIVRRVDVLFVPDDETRLQLLERGELDAGSFQGGSNIGRRAEARGMTASGAWGPTWVELDLDPERIGEDVAAAIVEAADPALVAEILEDSGRLANGIPARFPAAFSDGPWSGRGDLDRARDRLERGGYGMSDGRLIAPEGGQVTFQLAYPRMGAMGSLARFVHFRAGELGIRVELVGLDPGPFARDWEDRAPAMLQIRRGADAPDADAYAEHAPEAVLEATSIVAGAHPVVGVDGVAWGRALGALADAHVVAPLAQVRSWIIASPSIGGAEPRGSLAGPLWDVADWRRNSL